MITLDERATELYDVVRGCTLCALSETRTLAVPGEGPLTAEVMCIGEAPGLNEDKQGRPFVGAAGQFLSELLGAAGLTREQVYICNVLKCRPPNNRDPLPNEIDACSEYLDLQLDMVDPLVVVTLGRFSMSKWFPQQAISRIHGTVKEADGRFIVPMYHPAAALHQGSLRQVLLDDFAKLPAIVERARARRDGAPARALPPVVVAPPEVTQRPSADETEPRPGRNPRATRPAFDDDFEFDPGDFEPVTKQTAPEPDSDPPRVAAPPIAPPPPAPVALEQDHDEQAAKALAPQSKESTAEQLETAQAANQGQIRLFE